MDPSKLLAWLKLSPRYQLAAAVISGLMLFLPTQWYVSRGLAAVATPAHLVAGGVFCLSAVGLLAVGFGWVGTEWERRSKLQTRHQRLHHLTTDEKAMLRPYIQEQTRTQYHSIQDGVVRGLEMEQILSRVTSMGTHDWTWAYNIQPWAWKYLNEHPELLTMHEPTSLPSNT